MPTPTLEQIEQRLAETASMVEKGLEDVKKTTATKSELLTLINERTGEDGEIIKTVQADIDLINTGITEVKAQTDKLNESIRDLRKGSISAGLKNSLFAGGNYNGYFSCAMEAKAFALLVMAASTAGSEQVKDRHELAIKSLEKMGIDPYWVGPDGKKTMTGSSQAGGGALVLTEQVPTIMYLLESYGAYRANAAVAPMGAGSTMQPKIDGLLTITCPGEGSDATAADPDVKLHSMTAKTLVGLTAFSMELEEDSFVALGEMLAGLFARSFAYKEDLLGFLGDGTSTYFGFKGIAGALRGVDATIGNIKSLVVGTGNAYSELTLVDFEGLVGTIPQYADDPFLKWFMHRYFYYTVCVKLALASGGTPASEIIVGAGQKQKLWLGYPAVFAQVMPKVAANSQICALFANLKQGAKLGTRGGLEFATSSERYFEKGVIAVRGRNRIAVEVPGVGDTTNAGPVCGLITAAS